MSGETMGVIVVLVLCGLVAPIGLLLAAALFDALVVAWALLVMWHDGVWPAVRRTLHRAVAVPATYLHSHG